MKIVIPILDFSKSGGMRVLSQMATEWVKQNHEVFFLCANPDTRPYFPTQAQIIWLNQSSQPASLVSQSSWFRIPRNLFSLQQGLNQYAAAADVIMANHSLTAWPTYLSSSKAQKFYYIQAYEPEYYAQLPGLRAKILQMIAASTYRLPLKQVANAPLYCKYKSLKCVGFVPPGLDFSLMHPLAPPQLKTVSKVVIGCIGRKEPQKGIIYVVEAFQKLLADQNFTIPIELKVAYGNLPIDFKEIPHCTVVVPQNDQELGDYYRSLDILIAPGTVQLGAYHYPVMEAMACGIPVITTGYTPADDSNAWLVPIGDSLAIAEAIKQIVISPEITYHKVQKALLDINIYSWQDTSQKMLNYFHQN